MYHRTVDQVCDGWGTLITPYGSYNAIRMQQIQSNIDSTFNHTSGGWAFGTSTTLRYDTSYTWFAPGIGTVATISSKIPYRYSFYKPSAVNSVPSDLYSGMAVYPNPASETLNITNAGIGTKVSLCDATGRIVYDGTVNNNSSINMQPYPSGMYLLQLTDVTGNRITHKITRQ
jgi:hypothetical protein